MKILQINNVFPYGSTGKIVECVYDILMHKNNFESVVVYGNRKSLHQKNVYKIGNVILGKCNALLSRITGVMYGGCFFFTNKLIKIIKKEKPDIVHLHCLNGHFVNIYRLVTWLKTHDIKTVLTLHAEFMYTANCGHALDCDKWQTGCGHCPRLKQETKSFFIDGTHKSWMKMKKAFDGFNDNLIVTSVSPWLMERAKLSPILNDKKHEVVLNGVNTDVFHFYDTSELRSQMGLNGVKVIFHATPSFDDNINNIKGGYYVLKLAEKMLDENVKFIVAGNHPEGLKVPPNVILLGKVSDQELLAKYYSMADVTLLTSKKETFSMVTAESLCCGTPVVGFKAGAPEQIAIPEYSSFVDFGDLESLHEEMEKFLAGSFLKIDIALTSNCKYAKQTMVQSYIETYKELNNI